MNALTGVFKTYKEVVERSEANLASIRELESEKDACTVNGRLTRDGVKLLARIESAYEFRMGEIVPSVAAAKRAYFAASELQFEDQPTQ